MECRLVVRLACRPGRGSLKLGAVGQLAESVARSPGCDVKCLQDLWGEHRPLGRLRRA